MTYELEKHCDEMAPADHSPSLDGRVVAFGFVEQLTAGESSRDFLQQQPLLLLDLLQHALVLLCATRQIWENFVDGAVGDVLVGGVAGLTWKTR
jgi:hypothetical protein